MVAGNAAAEDTEPGSADRQEQPPLPDDFASIINGLPPCVKRLLAENSEPNSVSTEELLDALGKLTPATRRAASSGDVMQNPAALSTAACQSLRQAVDMERSTRSDTVDSGPEHQLNLNRERLEQIIGIKEARKLWRLPLDYRRWRRSSADDGLSPAAAQGTFVTDSEVEAEALTLQEAFVRRYSPETRPILKFHSDAFELTVNVALSADAAHGGGKLIGLFAGEVRALDRKEGDATVHSSSLLHAVSRMTSGTRYSLILFFDRKPGRYDPTRYEKRWVGGHAGSKSGSKGARWWEE